MLPIMVQSSCSAVGVTTLQSLVSSALLKEPLYNFIIIAGSSNGGFVGGSPVFAAGNEYAGNPAFPGAYSKCVCVSSLAADFTPACYTDFGSLVTLSAPGGDLEYYSKIGEQEDEYWAETTEQ